MIHWHWTCSHAFIPHGCFGNGWQYLKAHSMFLSPMVGSNKICQNYFIIFKFEPSLYIFKLCTTHICCCFVFILYLASCNYMYNNFHSICKTLMWVILYSITYQSNYRNQKTIEVFRFKMYYSSSYSTWLILSHLFFCFLYSLTFQSLNGLHNLNWVLLGVKKITSWPFWVYVVLHFWLFTVSAIKQQ